MARLVGRETELDALAVAVARLSAGNGGCLWISGEPGIGRSALLSAAAQLAAGADLAVCSGAAEPDGELSAPLSHWLAGDGGGTSGPAVVLFDDIQNADHESLRAWSEAARRIGQPHLLIAACRSTPQRAVLSSLRRSLIAGGAHSVELHPLTPTASEQFTDQLLRGVAGPRLRRLAEGAAGSPALLRQLIDALVGDDWLDRDGAAVELRTDDLPPSLGPAIADRLDQLSPGARQLLRDASLLGDDFSVVELGALCGASATRLSVAIREVLAAGLLGEHGDRLALRYPLIARVLLAAVPPADRQASQRATALSLVGLGASPTRIAAQLLEVADPPAAWVLDWLPGNLLTLARDTPDLARRLLLQVLPAFGRAGNQDERVGRLGAWGLTLLGPDEHLNGLLAELLAEPSSTSWSPAVAAALARALVASGQLAEAEAILPTTPHHRVQLGAGNAQTTAARALVLAEAGDGMAARALADAALASARSDGDRVAAGSALEMLIRLDRAAGRSAAALGWSEQALTIPGADPDAVVQRAATMCERISVFVDLGQPAHAAAAATSAVALAALAGPAALDRMRAVTSAYHLHTAAVAEAIRQAEAGASSAQPAVRVGCRSVLALIAVARDQPTEAEAWLRTTHAPDADGRHPGGHLTRGAWAALAEWHRDPPRALGALAPILDGADIHDVGPRELSLPDLVRIAVSVGDAAVAAAALAVSLTGVAQSPVRAACADHCRGLVDADPVSVGRAAQAYEEAGLYWHLARAQHDMAVLHAQRDEPAAAQVAWAVAHRHHRQAGALWLIRTGTAMLQSHGVRPRTAGTRPSTGWNALTPTERAIAELVAHGLANPAIAEQRYLSKRTVETHIAHIMTKLGVRTRAEVAQLVADSANAAGA